MHIDHDMNHLLWDVECWCFLLVNYSSNPNQTEKIGNAPCWGIQAHPSTWAAQARTFSTVLHMLLPGLYARCDWPGGHQWCNNVFEELLNDPRRLHFVTNGEHGAHQHGTCKWKIMDSVQIPSSLSCQFYIIVFYDSLISFMLLLTRCFGGHNFWFWHVLTEMAKRPGWGQPSKIGRDPVYFQSYTDCAIIGQIMVDR